MNRIFSTSLLCVLLMSPAFAQGVDEKDIGTYGQGVEILGASTLLQAVAQIPPDDRPKWELTLFVSSDCVSCGRLKEDMQTNRTLAAFAANCHYNVYELSTQSQRFRFRKFHVTHYPTIVLAPPIDSKYFPHMEVFRQAGYDGDAEGLAKKIASAIRRFIAKMVKLRPSPKPTFPLPLPFTPTPTPTPVDPNQPFLPTPLIPNLPPVVPDSPPPVAPRPQLQPGEYPDYPEIVLIVDADGLGESIKQRIAEGVIDRIKARYELDDVKVRVLKLEDAQGYPVTPADTPAVIFTKDGRIVAQFSAGIIDQIAQSQGWLPIAGGAAGWVVVVIMIVAAVVASRKGKQSP
ncbi:hypothetical protein LCGC14_0776450 [marine sediment metagenome]|uniref:Thioredoxin-like fold domain-containing protein n=1 Tax=marine sediment metagenome TaxID=412755 RepID=A0A0F9QGN2_9ZZZZ